MKASFLIKAKEEGVVTEKGLRVFVLERLLNSGMGKGTVENIDRKTVQVRLEGDERQVRQFVEELKKAAIEEFGNPKIFFTALEENPALEVPGIMRSNQALMVWQLHKGISVQLDILGTMKKMVGEMTKMAGGMANLPKGIAAALKGKA